MAIGSSNWKAAANVLVFGGGTNDDLISQEQIEELMRRELCRDRAEIRFREMHNLIKTRLEHGALVQPGPHRVSLRWIERRSVTRVNGPKHKKLIVD